MSEVRNFAGCECLDVAIVGMACVFPGAPDLATYWQNIVAGVDAIGEPPQEWDAHLYYDPDSEENDRTYCHRGGYLGDLARFDPLRHGVMPSSIDGGEPDHFLALRVACDALEDAGYPDGCIEGRRVEVVLGRGTYINRGYTNLVQHGMVVDQTLRLLKELHPEHSAEELQELKRRIKSSLPPFNAEVAPSLVPNIVSGRIANRLDFMGPNYIVDAACASSLIAVDQGMRDLLTGRCDVAVVGGVHASTPALIHMIFSQLGALSRRGEIKPFDKAADGTLLGEGVGIVVLKRTSDAEHDGDRVYAVIKGVGVASDGRALGLLAPRVEGEELALRLAYESSGIDPASVGLIEAHGTATAVGDATEIRALARVFGARRDGAADVAIGTVKSMIGHLLPASGVAGLIKAALALRHRVLPPTLHCDEPNPDLALATTPFYVNTEARPWIHGGASPRRAGVNAFGFGGINAHAVLEEHGKTPEAETLQRRWDSEVCVLAGESRRDLISAGEHLLEWLTGAAQHVQLCDIAATLGASAPGGPRHLAIVASSPDDLRRKLEHALTRLRSDTSDRIRDRSGIYFFDAPLAERGRLAVVFPGEGSQYPNMLADVCMHFPQARGWFDLMDRAFLDHERRPKPSQVVFPVCAAASTGAEAERRLWQMDHGAEAVFAANQALWTILTDLGLYPDGVLGHSTGDYSALLASGALRVHTEAELIRHILTVHDVYRRVRARGGIPQADLITVGGVTAEVLTAVVTGSPEAVYVAMDNCPQQVVMAGRGPELDAAMDRLRRQGAICSALPFTRAYHTPMFQSVCDELRTVVDQLPLASPTIEIYSGCTASRYPDDPPGIRQIAAEQWARPVRFRETVEAMYAAGYRIFVEAGPRGALTAFIDDILRNRPHLAVAAGTARGSGLRQLNHLVAQLTAHGVPLKLPQLWVRRAPQLLDLSTAEHASASEPRSTEVRLSMGLQQLRLTDEADRARNSSTHFGGTDARRAVPVPVPAEVPPDDHEGPHRVAAMRSYFETMDQFLALQTAVMGEHLAGASGSDAGNEPDAQTPDLRALPLVGDVVAFTPGREVVVVRRLDPEHDRFLLDHTLGGPVSAEQPGLTALAVMPFTMTMEMLAEVGSLLTPSQVLSGMHDVKAYRWITFDGAGVTVRLTARSQLAPDDDPGRTFVDVRMEDVGDDRAAVVIAEARVAFAPRYRTPPLAGGFPLGAECSSRWVAGELYSQGMFHGPSFRGVVSVDRSGSDGTEATLMTLPTDQLFSATPEPELLTDPVLLDAAGQLVGYWAAERLDTGFNVFPFRLRALHKYADTRSPGDRIACRARVRLAGDHTIVSDLDLVGSDGRVVARLEGWEDRRFELPPRLYGLRVRPANTLLATEWSAPVGALGEGSTLVCCRLDDLSSELLQAHGGIWRLMLAHLVLGSDERDTWQRLRGQEPERTEWLLARAVAKDAVRHYVQTAGGHEVLPADVCFAGELADGTLVAAGPVKQASALPLTACAVAGGVAVALASGPGCWRGLGVQVARRNGTGYAGARAPATTVDRLAELGLPVHDEWAARVQVALAAARRAVSRDGRRPARAETADPDTGVVTVAVGDTSGDTGGNGNELVRAWTSAQNDLVVACAVW